MKLNELNLDSYIIPYTQINSELIIDLKVRSKIRKLFRIKYRRKNLVILGSG